MKNILIVGYGNIGKHIEKEFKSFKPDIYDPFKENFNKKINKLYDFAFICVPTDKKDNGECDISIVEQAISETNSKIIIIKSTIPPTTTNYLLKKYDKNIIFSPENYGVTQHCKEDYGFVILGGEKELILSVAELYQELKNAYYRFYFTDSTTAELWKYMLNCFLALKVTFCCEFADIAKKFNVNYQELRELFIADERISPSHTFVYKDKPFYDSHCFNKDVPALVYFAKEEAYLMSTVNEINIRKKKEYK
ncbi:MAG: hypothetical protein V8R16_02215 [Bacilli bacterium]